MVRVAGPPVALAAVRGMTCAWLSVVGAASTSAEGEIRARVLEIGQQGRIAAGAPATVRVEVSADTRLSGVFRGRLVRPREDRSDLETLALASTELRFLLEAGEKRVLMAYLPDVTDRSCRATQLRWTVDAADGRRLVGNVEPVVCLSPALFESASFTARELYLSTEALPSRRTPSEAPDDVQSYAGYDRCLITGRDFGRLRVEQRNALLDWAALGGVLVLAAPLDASRGGISEDVVTSGALLWRDAAGHELRELSRHLGFVRSIDRPLASLVTDSRSQSPLYRLLTSAGGVSSATERDALRAFSGGWGPRAWRRYPEEDRVTRGLAAAALVILSILGIGLRRISRPRAATSPPVIMGAALLLALSPNLVYVATSTMRAGNEDRCANLLIHDRAGPFQSAWAYALLGGGGGRQDPALSFAVGPRVKWSAVRPGDDEDSVTAIADIDGRLRIEPERRGLGAERLIMVTLGQLQAADPAWEVDLTTDEPAVRSLRALRPYTRAGLVGPGGIVWMGSVRRGERIDLTGLRWPKLHELAEGDDLIDHVAWRLLGHTYKPSPGAPYPTYVVAAAPDACAVAVDSGGAFGAQPTIHVQALPAADPAGWLPAEREGQSLRIAVPNVLLARMKALGRELLPQTPFLDGTRPASLSASAAEGFSDVVFHVSGAVAPGRPGEGVVLGRWLRPARKNGSQ
jgi:hypothetical protein